LALWLVLFLSARSARPCRSREDVFLLRKIFLLIYKHSRTSFSTTVYNSFSIDTTRTSGGINTNLPIDSYTTTRTSGGINTNLPIDSYTTTRASDALYDNNNKLSVDSYVTTRTSVEHHYATTLTYINNNNNNCHCTVCNAIAFTVAIAAAITVAIALAIATTIHELNLVTAIATAITIAILDREIDVAVTATNDCLTTINISNATNDCLATRHDRILDHGSIVFDRYANTICNLQHEHYYYRP